MIYSLIISIGIAIATLNSGVTPSEYKFIKKDKQISLSSRELKLHNGRTTRELRAEFTINGSLEKMKKVLKDEQLSRRWMKGVEYFSVLSRESDNDWKAYIRYNIPWPLSNQDCIISYNCITTHEGKGLTIKMNGLPDYLPKKDGVERISHISGCWTITQSTNTCRVVYTVYSEQKPKFPLWATDPIVQQNLINSLSSLKELAEK